MWCLVIGIASLNCSDWPSLLCAKNRSDEQCNHGENCYVNSRPRTIKFKVFHWLNNRKRNENNCRLNRKFEENNNKHGPRSSTKIRLVSSAHRKLQRMILNKTDRPQAEQSRKDFNFGFNSIEFPSHPTAAAVKPDQTKAWSHSPLSLECLTEK